MAEIFKMFVELCKTNQLEEAKKYYFANEKIIDEIIDEGEENIIDKTIDENEDEENIVDVEDYVVEFKNDKIKEIIENFIKNFIKLCKENNLKEAKKFYFANKNIIIDEIREKEGYDIESHIYEHIVELLNNKQYNAVNLIFKLGLCDLDSCFNYSLKNDVLELTKYILQISNINIWEKTKEIISACDLQKAKNMFKIKPELFLNINDDYDYILREICFLKNSDVYKTLNIQLNQFSISHSEHRLKMIQWILEDVKPDYDIISIKTIKDGIEFNFHNYIILKYLNGYIDKREKIILQEMINKCIIDNYIIFATATETNK